MVELLTCPLCDKIGKGYFYIRKKLSFLPHIPTLILSIIIWWFYQVYVCGYLAFVEGNFLWQAIYGVFVCSGIIMVASSLYATTFQRYPLRPYKFSVGDKFLEKTWEEQNLLINDIIKKTGANVHHVNKVCLSCNMIRTERSHHCAICNICTPRMDHHCVVLHKCIHYKNQKQFCLIFFWMCLSAAVALSSLHSYAMRASNEATYYKTGILGILEKLIHGYTWLYTKYMGVNRISAELMIASFALTSILAYFLCIIFCVVMCSFVWFCVIQNGTIVACNKSARLGGRLGIYFVDSKTRCFRKKTMLQNMQVIFGKDIRMWLLPVPNNDSDGWLHSCECKIDV